LYNKNPLPELLYILTTLFKDSNVNSQRHQSGSRTMHQPGPMLLPCPR
jgi:hypothetical protein